MTRWVGEVALMLSARFDVALVAKATLILALGLATMPLARRARASVRHLILAATFGTVLVLPLVVRTVPALTVPVPVLGERYVEAVSRRAARAAAVGDAAVANDGALLPRPSLAMLARAVWAGGTVLLLVLWAIDIRRLRTLRRGGLPWIAQRDLARSLAVACGVRRAVDVLLHEDVSSPLTCGIWRPAILLPVDATKWSAADLRRALVHELEHVRRGDWMMQCAARVACACYWFHPLAWMAWRRLRLEAERACDDAVVQGAECTAYAEQLVGLARRLSTVSALPSLAMASRSDLSVRVCSLLDATRRRGRAGRATIAGAIGAASLVVLVVAPLRAIAAPTAAAQRGETAQTRSDAGAAVGSHDRSVRVRPAASRRQTPSARRDPGKPRVPKASAKPRVPNAGEKPRAPIASEKPRRVSAEPRKPASARAPRVIERPGRAQMPRTPARAREPRARSTASEATWATQSARTITVPPGPGDGAVAKAKGSHSALESATAQQSSSGTSSSGSP